MAAEHRLRFAHAKRKPHQGDAEGRIVEVNRVSQQAVAGKRARLVEYFCPLDEGLIVECAGRVGKSDDEGDADEQYDEDSSGRGHVSRK
jgi:hypothetical protein